MTCTPSPFPLAVLAEATRISPHRRGSPWANGLGIASSDGICGDAAHQARTSDHDPDARGIPHAVDISQSKPGTPYWDPRCGVFDAHAYGEQLAARMLAGREPRVKYLVSHNYATGRAKILNLAVSRAWRDQDGDNHASHLHVSFTVAAERSTSPFFAPAAPAPPKPRPPLPAPTSSTQEIDVNLTITDTTVDLDARGNGYFDLGGVGDPDVKFWGVIGTPDPQVHGYGTPIPIVAFTLNAHGTARFEIKGGAPNQRVTVRVTHT